MSTLYVMIGIPGSGKSTFAKKLKAEIVSRDEIRFSFLKNENEPYFKYEDKVFKKFIQTIQKCLDKGNDCIADATHLNVKSRYKLLYNLNLENVDIIPIIMNTNLKTCLKRNEKREGLKKVPKETIINMSNNLEFPNEYETNLFNYKEIITVKED